MAISLLLFSWFWAGISANDYFRFQTFSNHEGLNQNTINALAQDQNGMLWIGTPNGLIRYDGYDFEEYTWDPNEPGSINNNQIDFIHTDNNGLLWVINNAGIQIFDPQLDRFYDIELYGDPVVNRLVEGSDSAI